MSRHPTPPSDLSWDKRPMTVRDLGIVLGVLIFMCIAGAALLAFALRGQAETAASGQSAASSGAQTIAQGSAGAGQTIFEQKCISCHSIGGGIVVGPDLEGVTERRDVAWLTRWISEPDVMLAEGDPIATELLAQHNNVPMPNSGLTAAEVRDVISYLTNPSGGSAAAAAVTLPIGDPRQGEALFTGAVPLQNGGPACMSCHSTGAGVLNGGTLGPDLTQVYQRYGEAGLPSTLVNLPFPTMQGVFSNRPLTEVEAADLYAYFSHTNQADAQPVNHTFTLIGLIGCLIFIALSQVIWRKRLKAVRKPLLGGAQ